MLVSVLLTIAKAVGAILCLAVLVACAQIYRNSGTQALQVPAADTLRIATYNVHYIVVRRETGNWSMADWERRKGPLNAAFNAVSPDLIGFQEMESFAGASANQANLALTYLLEQNPGYAAAASGDPLVFPNTQPILYRAERLEALDQGWFFFSETPDVLYSRTFNGSFPAFASWAQFRDLQTGSTFRVINIHTDFASRTNRLRSMELVAERITPWIDAGENVIVLGDFNARLGSPILGLVEETGVSFAPVEGATFHFNRGLNLFAAIDHIGWAGDVDLTGEPTVLRERFLGEWPTDHYPYLVDLVIR